ncbi:MAG: YHYH protein [Phycisphaerales bacterium JB065]
MAHPGHDDAPPNAKRPADVPPPGESTVTIEMRQGYRYIDANGLPDHDTGRFPGPGNPNAIEAQNYQLRVPITPKLSDEAIPYDRQPFGVALNGVLFDPFTAGFWNDDPDSGWREAADPNRRNLGLDANHAHVQPNGAYHYHGVPVPLITDTTRMTLIGWAADGFPIYGPYGYKDADSTEGEIVLLRPSYRLKSGNRPDDGPPGAYDGTYDEDFEYVEGSGDLDECNGRTGPTPEFPYGTYYYVVSNEYPYVPRLFRAEPDPSFDLRGHNGPRNGARGTRRGRPGVSPR